AQDPEHVPASRRPALRSQLVVDLEGHAAIGATTLRGARSIGPSSVPAAAVQDDLHGRIAGERAPRVLVEPRAVARDDEHLPGDLGTMGRRAPAKRALVEELAQEP